MLTCQMQEGVAQVAHMDLAQAPMGRAGAFRGYAPGGMNHRHGLSPSGFQHRVQADRKWALGLQVGTVLFKEFHRFTNLSLVALVETDE